MGSMRILLRMGLGLLVAVLMPLSVALGEEADPEAVDAFKEILRQSQQQQTQPSQGTPPPNINKFLEMLQQATNEEAAAPQVTLPEVNAADVPNDGGGIIDITWDEFSVPEGRSTSLDIVRISPEHPEGDVVGSAPAEAGKFTDSNTTDGVEYSYFLRLSDDVGTVEGPTSGTVVSKKSYFNFDKLPLFIIALAFSGAILYNIQRARSGQDLYIRPIAGLNALEEAVGRATEMGRPVLYVPGIQDMDSVMTIAGVSILGSVAKTAAEYDCELLVPTSRSVVMTACQNVVKEAYYEAGRPDGYNPNNIYYVTDDQFGYAAAVDGLMVREKPAANFFLGHFYAESLILAETGNSVGAIQISGTAEASQLPFFVAACDYTLLGEELFAASAYLTREPLQLGSIKGQDWGKFLIMITIIVAVILFQINPEVKSLLSLT